MIYYPIFIEIEYIDQIACKSRKAGFTEQQTERFEDRSFQDVVCIQ